MGCRGRGWRVGRNKIIMAAPNFPFTSKTVLFNLALLWSANIVGGDPAIPPSMPSKAMLFIETRWVHSSSKKVSLGLVTRVDDTAYHKLIDVGIINAVTWEIRLNFPKSFYVGFSISSMYLRKPSK